MYIKPSAYIRKNYKDVASLCKATGEPVYLTNNGEGELVVMSIEAYEGHTQQAKIQQDLLRLELEKAKGFATYTDIDDFDAELAAVIDAAQKGSVASDG